MTQRSSALNITEGSRRRPKTLKTVPSPPSRLIGPHPAAAPREARVGLQGRHDGAGPEEENQENMIGLQSVSQLQGLISETNKTFSFTPWQCLLTATMF